MSAVASMLEVPEPEVSAATDFTRIGRLAAAGTLVLGAACQVAVFAIEPQHSHTVDRLRWIAGHPDRANVAKLFDVLAMPFLLGLTDGHGYREPVLVAATVTERARGRTTDRNPSWGAEVAVSAPGRPRWQPP